jgi:hypothetical protein
LIINSTKFSGRVLKSAIGKYMQHRKEKHNEHMAAKAKADVVSHGKMSVKELNAQGQGLTLFELEKDDGIRQFERIARKYGVDYAVRKTKDEPPKYVVFFKSRDKESMDNAFKEFFTAKLRKQNREPLRKKLARVLPFVGSQKKPEKNKNQERSR